MRFLEPPHPNLNLDGKYIRFKYCKSDCCEIPCLRLGRVVNSGAHHYLLEQIQPEHGIRKFLRERIICYEILESKNDQIKTEHFPEDPE